MPGYFILGGNGMKESKDTKTGVNEGKAKALENVLADIQKAYGKESIMKMSKVGGVTDVKAISTGSLALDLAIGIGGIPRGRVIEIFGPESTGKTTLALCVAAQAQKAGGTAAYIDAEHAMDPDYARKLGVDIDNLLISQPDNGEQALEITDKLVRSGAIDIIVIDSVAALVPRAELEGEMGASSMGVQARLMSQALRKLTVNLKSTSTTVIFINQLRQKIGVMFGNPEVTPGGLALKYYASVRLDIRRVEAVKKGDDVIGNHVRVKVVKNKVAAPFKKAEFDILFGAGIDNAGSVIDMAVEAGIVEKSGAFYSYKTERIGQGRENAKAFMLENPTKLAEIEATLRETKVDMTAASADETAQQPEEATV